MWTLILIIFLLLDFFFRLFLKSALLFFLICMSFLFFVLNCFITLLFILRCMRYFFFFLYLILIRTLKLFIFFLLLPLLLFCFPFECFVVIYFEILFCFLIAFLLTNQTHVASGVRMKFTVQLCVLCQSGDVQFLLQNV